MSKKLEAQVYVKARQLTEGNGAFTLDAMYRHGMDALGYTALRAELDRLVMRGVLFNNGNYYRVPGVRVTTDAMRKVGQLLVPPPKCELGD